MEKYPIPVPSLALQSFTAFDTDGILLVAGRGVDDANPMTISWGMFGIMWGRPVMMVMVRPTRHTWSFIAEGADFTANWLPADWREALRLCGSASGRDMDKFAASGLQPVASTQVQSPSLAESVLTLECRVLYRSQVEPASFVEPALQDNYPGRDYHGLFFGEIVAALGIDRFRMG